MSTIVEDSELVQAFRELAPTQLSELVQHVALEDSGALLALATPDQLRGLADEDLWHEVDDTFDSDRFAVWLEVLLQEGTRVAGDALLALDEDLLAHALADRMFVLDLDALATA